MRLRLSQESKSSLSAFVALSLTIAYPSSVQSAEHDKSLTVREQILLKTVDPDGLRHWRKWRDQHSTIWFQHDWRIFEHNGSHDSWKHLNVRLYKTPGAQLNKAGEQTVLKIFDQGKLIYCSDKASDYRYDELGDGEPLYISNLDNDKIAILSTATTAFSITVFAYKNGTVRKVLCTGSKNYPEFAYPANSTLDQDIQIITTSVISGNVATLATVYSWNSKSESYERKTVSFAKRFDPAYAGEKEQAQ